MRTILHLLSALTLFAAATAVAQAPDRIRVGFINTFSGPGGAFGNHHRDGFNLALERLGGKLGGVPADVVYYDDQLKADMGSQGAEQLLSKDRAQILAGFNFSNVLMAAIGPAQQRNALVVSSNAGPAPLAGAQCDPSFFAVGHQNDGAAEAMGMHLQKQGVQNVYLIAPNYQAGKDMLAGFKRHYKGKIVNEVYTNLTQQDYAAELAAIRASKPGAVFAFMPGGNGMSFLRQWSQAGLAGQIPFYSVYTVDHVTLKAIGDVALGLLGASQWVEDLPNEANREFIQAFVKKYGYMPAEYAAQSYDTAVLLDSALRAVGGNIQDRPALVAALRKANFKSVRGEFRFNTNHFPIQAYYLREVVRKPDGSLGFVTRETIVKEHRDAYAAQCKMK
jgi:branched-chain amino acid transport system substrate-binding protein